MRSLYIEVDLSNLVIVLIPKIQRLSMKTGKCPQNLFIQSVY